MELQSALAAEQAEGASCAALVAWGAVIRVRGGYLLVQEREAWSTAGSAHVLRTGDFFEVATFPASLFNEEAPLGGAFVDEGLLLQRLRNGTSGREFVAELYGITDAGAKLKDSWLYRTLPSGSGYGTSPSTPQASRRSRTK